MKRLIEISIVIVFLLLINFSPISQAFENLPTSPAFNEENPNSHAQPSINYVTGPAEFEDKHKYASVGNLAVNFYQNPKLIFGNTVLNDDDSICLGDTVSAKDTDLGGEWFAKGGPIDSPPITWVTEEQMQNIINNVRNYNNANPTLRKRPEKGVPQTIISNEQLLGIKITLYSAPIFVGYMNNPGFAYGTLICTSNSQATSNEYRASQEGYVTYEIKSSPACIYYLESIGGSVYGGGGWEQITAGLTDVNALFTLWFPTYQQPGKVFTKKDLAPNWITNPNLVNLTSHKTLRVVSDTTPPDLKVNDYSISENGIVRMLVKNTGGMDAQLDDIKSNYGFSITNKPLIKAGETKEVFGKLSDSNVDKEIISFNPVYRATELGCLSNKLFGAAYTGGCSMDKDCESGLCCLGKCRDATKGFCDDLNRDGTPDTWVVFEE